MYYNKGNRSNTGPALYIYRAYHLPTLDLKRGQLFNKNTTAYEQPPQEQCYMGLDMRKSDFVAC